jgi:hypothetical protein
MALLELAEDHWDGLVAPNIHNPVANGYRIGLSLYKKLFNAHIEAKDHQERFERFSNLQLKDVPEWERMTEAWEKDHSHPNPYTVTKSGRYSLNSQ